MLKAAQIHRIMIDVFQWKPELGWKKDKVLDSGSYAIYKGKQPKSVH
jgi:hypothetical protein